MTGAFDLLVIGDANPDVLVSGAPETPPAGQAETLVDGGTLALGGSAAIVAHGAARLGLSTALVALVGRDPAGDFVLDVLSAAGVEIRFCTRHESLPTALTVCLNRPDGDRAILTAPGCLAAFGPEHVPDVAARHVHAASYFLQPRLAAGLPELFAGAKVAGASTSLDTNDDPAGEWRLAPGLLAGCDLLLPNEAEAGALAGALGARQTAPRGDPLADALATLVAAGPTPVVKLGRRGAVAGTRSGAGMGTGASVVVMNARGPEVEPVDTVGAGDSFDAGFLAGWLDSGDLAEGLALGCACGALSTGAVGGTAAQPGRDEAESLAARVRVTHGR
ncbi:MAG TPA: carbohydrate kinase family protein [Streptosporangiaceae bacterium]|nr:carbohydrate kinase family protein [Streptosporangiaceae bacterium]